MSYTTHHHRGRSGRRPLSVDFRSDGQTKPFRQRVSSLFPILRISPNSYFDVSIIFQSFRSRLLEPKLQLGPPDESATYACGVVGLDSGKLQPRKYDERSTTVSIQASSRVPRGPSSPVRLCGGIADLGFSYDWRPVRRPSKVLP